MSVFKAALAFVLQCEGGYENNPRDHGGATNKGITQRTYDAWCIKNGKPLADIRDIREEAVADIYETEYWEMARCDFLPDKLALIQFDVAVQRGPFRAVKMLQACCGVTPDGIWGRNTYAAATTQDEATLVDYYLKALRDHYADVVTLDPGQGVFLAGWNNRTDDLEKMLKEAA